MARATTISLRHDRNPASRFRRDLRGAATPCGGGGEQAQSQTRAGRPGSRAGCRSRPRQIAGQRGLMDRLHGAEQGRQGLLSRRPARKERARVDEAQGGDGDRDPSHRRPGRQRRQFRRGLPVERRRRCDASRSAGTSSRCSPRTTAPGRAHPSSTSRSSPPSPRKKMRWSRARRKRATATTDTYSLAGFAKALALIDKACDVKR